MFVGERSQKAGGLGRLGVEFARVADLQWHVSLR
jgi:hypothetical protein